ncbi:MAG: outer membrane lipid asymmetry maintenance protein MlaD [Desulfobacterota bacterium]|nr:outer membrane lipid asymmetry maintenance protein MlaD [Thermodesulfobacteriota bacterium]
MRQAGLEFAVGMFIIAGILSLGYISTKYAKMEVFGQTGYQLTAIFPNIGGLKKGAQVEIAGVQIGRVKDITLDNYRARVVLTIQNTVKIPDDAIARIKTKGLLGEKYIDIVPGGSDIALEKNESIRETQPPVDIEDLISKFVFGKL